MTKSTELPNVGESVVINGVRCTVIKVQRMITGHTVISAESEHVESDGEKSLYIDVREDEDMRSE